MNRSYNECVDQPKQLQGLISFAKARFFKGFFSDLGSQGTRRKKSSENDQLTGHFQTFSYLQNKQKNW